MFRKGRPFLKRVHFEVHLEVILGPKRGPQSQLYSFLVDLVAKRELLNIGSNLDRKKNLKMNKHDSKKGGDLLLSYVVYLPLSDSPPLVLPLKGTPASAPPALAKTQGLSGIYIYIYIYIYL